MTQRFRSGFVTIAGRPNVGKSTFLNCVLETKISIASAKPQTTRDRILGILSEEDSQIIFLDTPGIHASDKDFNRYLVEKALSSLADADIVMVMAEPYDTPELLETITGPLAKAGKEALLVLNKIDLLGQDAAARKLEELAAAFDFSAAMGVSAISGHGIPGVMTAIRERLPEGPRYFPEDMITDASLRFLCQELIREKVFTLTSKEIPYAVAVQVERFEEGSTTRIQAVIHVERDSQKGIVIGKGGRMLKQIGQQARLDMQRLIGSKVYLELFVRVTKDWTKNPRLLRELGYK